MSGESYHNHCKQNKKNNKCEIVHGELISFLSKATCFTLFNMHSSPSSPLTLLPPSPPQKPPSSPHLQEFHLILQP